MPSLRKQTRVLAAFVALSLLSCLNSLLVRLSKREGVFAYKTVLVPLLSECLKLVLSVLSYVTTEGTLAEAVDAVLWTNSLRYALPSLCYLVQNNLVFVALHYLEPPVFQLMSNLKILSTALLFRITFATPLNFSLISSSICICSYNWW